MQLALAIDGHSMFYTQQKLGWFFDPRRLMELASAQSDLEVGSAFWYLGLKDSTDQRPFRDALTSLGFSVRTQRQYARANLEVEIALDLMAVSGRTDVVWLLSGSRDLERTVEVLRARGLKIVLINTDGMVPRELRNAVDRFWDLASLRPQLERSEALQAPVFSRNTP